MTIGSWGRQTDKRSTIFLYQICNFLSPFLVLLNNISRVVLFVLQIFFLEYPYFGLMDRLYEMAYKFAIPLEFIEISKYSPENCIPHAQNMSSFCFDFSKNHLVLRPISSRQR